jgi:RNA polymerase sigma-70 factor (ECF subfamily)
MLLHRLRKKATSGVAAEVCVEAEFLAFDQDTLTLEEKVTRYFEQWRDPVHRYVVAAFGDPAEAEDITQEAFLRLYRSLHSGQSIVNVRAWVFRTAHNLASNRLRSDQFIELLDETAWEDLRQTLRDSAANPEQRLAELEKFNRLRLAVARLTLAERQCLHLRTKGLRYKEIAEILGLGTSTIAETLYRVIDKLTQESNG